MENIRYGNEKASDEDCIKAAKLVNADGFIRMLPKWYNTIISGNGEGLSQGQLQLISIARAAVADPPAMILDEATSSIDTRTEKLVQGGMDHLMNGRTTFVTAHRLSTVKNSDEILVLDHGAIIERGSHQELIAKKETGFSFRIGLRYGAGAFVCGEETALLNSIEGKRGMPRPKPPFPAISGLWGKPTVINNVETLANVPYIVRVGPEEYAKIGTEKSKGTKVFALGGKVKNVGLVEVPMGTTLRTLIFDIGGGIQNDKKFQAIQTGGPSGGCLTTDELDVPIDYDSLIAHGSMMGSGGAIVMDEDNCMVDVAKFYMQFICDESCGKCSQCRIGTKRLLEIMTRITDGKGTMEDLDKLEALSQSIKVGALCGLGQTAANPILSTLSKFHDVYIRHIVDKKCDAGVCKKLISYHIDPNKCRKCSLCARNCPVGAITGVVGKEAFVIDEKKCIKCGTCMAGCHFNAIYKE